MMAETAKITELNSEVSQYQEIDDLLSKNQFYKEGFVTSTNVVNFEKGINEQVVRAISAKKNEPEWMLQYRLEAFRIWQEMEEPEWAHVNYPAIDYQDIVYFSQPKKKKLDSLDEVDPELLDTFNKLGISLEEQKQLTGVAVDAVLDSVSVKTTFQDTLEEKGIIFCARLKLL